MLSIDLFSNHLNYVLIMWRKDKIFCWLCSCPIYLYAYTWWPFLSLFYGFLVSFVFWFVLRFFLFVFFFVTCCTCEMPYFYRCLYCFGRCYGFHTLFFSQFIVTQTVVFRLSVLSISLLSVVYICSNFLCWLVSLLLKIHRLSIHTQQL